MNKKDKKKNEIKDNILNTTKGLFDSGTEYSKAFKAKVSKLSKDNFPNQYNLLLTSLSNSKKLDMPTKEEILIYYSSANESLRKRKDKALNQASILVNAILASDFSTNMSKWLEGIFEGAPTVYDKALDNAYLLNREGGGLHRLFDGSHTFWDAWDKAQGALDNDSFAQEVIGYTNALIKDLTTEMGLPIFGMTKENYDFVASTMSENFNIPKDWVSDILCINGAEVIGTSIGVLSVALNWKKEDVKEFSSIASSLGISTIASANPLLAVVALVSLAKSFADARRKNKYSDFVNGLTKGGVGTGMFIATATVIGGPVWVGVVSGMCVAVCVHKAMDKVEVIEIVKFVQTTITNGLQKQNILLEINETSMG